MGDSLARFLTWSVKRIGQRTLLQLACLWAIQANISLALSSLTRGLDAWSLLWPALWALIAGWLLARSAWRGAISAVILIGLGSLAAWMTAAGALLDLLLAAAATFQALRAWDAALLLPALAGLSDSIQAVVQAVSAWVAGSKNEHLLALTFLWAWIVWLLAAWSAWAVRRLGNSLLAALPTGVILAASLSYTRANPLLIAPFLAVTLLLICLLEFNRQQTRWQDQRLDYSDELAFDAAFSASAAVLAVLIGSALLSFISIRGFGAYISRLVAEPNRRLAQAADALGLEPVRDQGGGLGSLSGLYQQAAGQASLPRRHLLGSGPELSRQAVMTVQTDDPQAGPHPAYYWRALTYDVYTGQGWETSAIQWIQARARQLAGTADAAAALELITNQPATRRLRQTVTLRPAVTGVVHVAGSLYRLDRQASLALRSDQDLFAASLDSSIFTAESFLRIPDRQALLVSGVDYPAWIAERYLQLPAKLPPRLQTLAREIAASAATPYEKASAIESYLRRIPYTLDLDAPPRDRDVVDYFLFDLRTGYCDYYATSMVVLLRSLGIPARLVVGYAAGSYQSSQNHYLVTEADAHSWPEAYFPAIGWVEFEPTGSRPSIPRLQNAAQAGLAVQPPSPNNPASGQLILTALAWIGGAAGLLALLPVAWSFLEERRLSRMPPLESITAIFDRLRRQAKRLQVPILPGMTPAEYSLALAERLSNLEGKERAAESRASARTELGAIADGYARSIYSASPPTTADQQAVLGSWKRLRTRLLRAWARRLRSRLPLFSRQNTPQ
jgi:transglutaminase-like putative cysteine protease